MRLVRLRELMAENNLDGMLITQPENRRYLSGFTGSAGVLIVTAERQVIATDFRYYDQVQAQCPEWELIQVGYDFVDKMLDALRDLGLGGLSVGFEASHVSVDHLLSWERALKAHVRLTNTTQMIEDMRMSKDVGEIQAIRRAVELADEALAHTSGCPGLAERSFELLPGLRRHTCANDAGRSFAEELHETETAHLYEHVACELMALAGSPRHLKGRTSWDFGRDGRGTYRVRVEFDDDLVALGAFKSAVPVVTWLVRGQGVRPDIGALTARLIEVRRD